MYCHKKGHLVAECKKKARGEKTEGRRIAALAEQPGALQDTRPLNYSASVASDATTLLQGFPGAPGAPGAPAGVRAVLPEDLASGAALLAQQALFLQRARQLQSAGGGQLISLCAMVPVPEEPWPDTDEEIGIYAIGAASIGASARLGDTVWALWDSGSGLTTCPVGYFPDGEGA